MLRESFDLINGHLVRSVPGTSPSSVETSSADESSVPYAYVSSGGSSSSSPVPSFTNNNESSTTSSVESSDQEEQDTTDKVGTHTTSIGHDAKIDGMKAPRKSDFASSADNDTDETAESSHDDQNIDDTDESENAHSEDDEVGSGEESSGAESEGEESFADDAYIQTDEVTLSASDLERLRCLRPHGGGIKTTIPSKRTASCMEALGTVHEKEAFHDTNGKRPRLAIDIEQISSTQSQQQQSSPRRRPSASRSA